MVFVLSSFPVVSVIMCYVKSTDGMGNSKTIYDHTVSSLQTLSKGIAQGTKALLWAM